MTTHDHEHDHGDGHPHDHADGTTHEHHHHPGNEGEYEDKDVTDAPAHEAAGEYTDHDVTAARPAHPHDEGGFADHDVESTHRHVEAEGSYADIAIGDEDVEENQVARAHEHHSEPGEFQNPGRDEVG